MYMQRRTIRLLIASLVFLLAALLLAGCPNFTQDTDPVLGEFESVSPNDTKYDQQWNLDYIAMEKAWGVLNSSEVNEMLSADNLPREVVVAVLDTKIDAGHPDWNEWTLLEHFNATEEDEPYADNHGTHVAGTIAAAADNNDGIAGVGWIPSGARVRIMPISVFVESDNPDPNITSKARIPYIVDGLLYAADMHPGKKPERSAHVINLSLGQGQFDSVLHDAIKRVQAEGITVVAAAGNNSCGPVLFPAFDPNTIAVGSTNPPDDNRAAYSSCGDAVDIAAPGGGGPESDDSFSGILSLSHTNPDEDLSQSFVTETESDDYTNMAGTSMAAPHVSGVAALLYAVTNDMTPSAVRQILTETASPVTHAGSLPNEEYGWGLLNAERAVRRALMKPYGPYRNDGSATVHESWPFSPQGNIDIDTPDSTEPPPEGTYATDRAALVLEDEWYSSTSGTQRQARLDEIAQEHGLASIADRGHRYPSARLRDGDEISTDLLEALGDEPEIRTAEYSVFFYRQ